MKRMQISHADTDTRMGKRKLPGPMPEPKIEEKAVKLGFSHEEIEILRRLYELHISPATGKSGKNARLKE